MQTPKLRYEVIADDKTAKGIKSAEKNVSGFDKTIKNLGKTFASVFAAQKIYAFGKASVEAFAQDQKSAALLANTVKNLGLAFETPAIEDFISRLSQAAGIADDQLRPAMQNLLTTTGSVVKSQNLLTQAVDISRGSSVDFSTVVQDLSNAYVGNTKGLKKYYLGLTQAELKAKSFAEIQALLNKQFAGASSDYLETYAGKMEKLNTAAGEAKETIGKGILDAISILGGEGVQNIDGATSAMQRLSTATAEVLVGQATFWDKLFSTAPGGAIKKAAGAAGWYFAEIFGINASRELAQIANNPATGYSTVDNYNMTAKAKEYAKAKAKAEMEAAKRAKEILKSQQAASKLAKDQAMLKKQSALFDIQQIELVAALKGQLSDDERKRAELQLALLQGNETLAAKLSTELANSIDKTGNLAKYLQTLPDANNPFKSWQAYLDAIEAQVKRISGYNPSTGTPTVYPGGGAAVDSGYTGTYDFYQNPATGGSVLDSYQPTVTVQFAGTGSLVEALRDSFVSASMEGSFSQINRSVGAFDR